MKIASLFTFTFLCFLISPIQSQVKSHAKLVVVSGKVLNHDPKVKQLEIGLCKVGLGQQGIFASIDSVGNFTTNFNLYVPTDAWITYKTNFMLILLHPGDSLFFEFDGKYQNRLYNLKSVKFSGKNAKLNQETATFQISNLSKPYKVNLNGREVKEYDLEKYKLYLDTLKQENQKVYDQFVKDVSPCEEAILWAKLYLDKDYYTALAYYPLSHQRLNKLKDNEWSVPVEYYNPIKDISTIEQSGLIGGYSVSSLANIYRFYYIWNRVQEDTTFKRVKKEKDKIMDVQGIVDSIQVAYIIKYANNNLLKQMMLTEKFKQDFESYNFSFFEKNRKLYDKHVKEQFLRKPLLEEYSTSKERLQNPKISTKVALNKIKASSAKEIMDSILIKGKNKVIYIDCWATWCGSCLSEMPRSKTLMGELAGKEVEFVYLCFDSEEKIWKANLAKFKLEGQQYFLDKQQSTDIKKALGINSFPFYFLMDKEGTITEKGSHLRPGYAKEKILTLIKK